MLPFNGWFCIFFLHILEVVVYELAMIYILPSPADQLGLIKVCYLVSTYLGIRIRCDAPLFASLQVNHPYFFINYVP